MSVVIALIVQGLHLALMLAAAPVVMGLHRRFAARLAGQAGPSPWQPWRDFFRLARKQPTVAATASPLFEVAPALAFAATLLAAALVPAFARGMAGGPLADLIVLAGLLLLARATLACAALESGTALGGAGASRAMALAACTEPAFLLAILPLALLLGTTNLDAMAGLLRAGAPGLRVPLVLAIAALLTVALARAGGDARAWFGEAAMAEGALAQEYGGRHLALLQWSAALRRLLWLDLLADLACPVGLADATGSPLSWLLGLLAWAIKIVVLSAALALWQSARAARPGRLAEVLGLAVLLALLAALFLFAGQGLA